MTDNQRREKMRRELGRDPSWEEFRWPTLSPAHREAHNKLRAMRGQPPLPPPEKDLYVAPPKRTIKPVVDMTEAEAEIRGMQARLGMMDRVLGRGQEGFREAE